MFGFGKDSWSKARELFEDQFEPAENGYIYRRSQRGAPIPISAAERETFIDEFNGRVRLANWGTIVTTLIVVGIAVWASARSHSKPSETLIFIGIGGVLALFMIFYFWAWNAPSRELESRTPIGNERSKDEVRAMTFQRLTYGRLVGGAALGVFIVVIRTLNAGDGYRLHVVWLVLGAFLLLISAVQAFRKWRFERGRNHA